MKRIFHLHQYLDDLIVSQRGYKSPAEKDRAIHIASRELFNYFNGGTGEYQKGLPMARVGYGLTTVVNNALAPFLRTQPYFSNAAITQTGLPLTAGRFELPEGFVHPTSFRVPTAKEEVRVLNENQVTARLNSPMNAPTPEYPFVEAVEGGYQVYPATVPALTLRYLGTVPEVKYALLLTPDGELDLDEDGLPQYDDASSVDHGWGPAQENNLLWLASKVLAGESRDQYMQQFSELQAQKG